MVSRVAGLIGRVHPRLAVVLHDLLMVWAAWLISNALRFSLAPNAPPFTLFPPELPVVLLAQGAVLWWTGLYRGLWRFASLPDLWNIARACLFGALAVFSALFLLTRLENVPRTVLALYPLTLLVCLGAPRWLYRFWKDSRYGGAPRLQPLRVLVIGAGSAGEALVRDLRREGRFRPVGLIDDNRALRGAKVHGVPVLGDLDQLAQIAREVAAEMLLIAMPSASNQQMQRAVERCEDSGLPFRTVPRLQDVIEGRSSFNQLKEVAIEDLLGRDPVALDWTAIRTGLSGRRVLVSGGGGSIGSELCRQVARLGVSSLIVLEQSEYNLYRIEQELRAEFPELLVVPVLGDCGDPAVAEFALSENRPQLVFHAAAYKHVPLLEGMVREAVRNNVLSTQVLAQAALRHGVGSFVLISSDKAVNPANVMGASKRLAELLCQTLQGQGGTRFVTVRFGNVLDSAGSVVPLFREQIRRGGPVTVTHPEITRYFMTIPEACQLILQAATLGEGGEIFALDMGQPVKIQYLAEQMIRLAGKRPGEDIRIEFTGLRAGEKLFEELFHPQEDYQPTRHPKIMLAQPRELAAQSIQQQLLRLRQASQQYDSAQMLEILQQLVPEFRRSEDAPAVVSLHRVS
ncbi:polysaccharide biosynthesis protein [Aquimonas voraii]|uniref:NDP-sugar epimerase, includes UDP-GlcNAc-inverting 4,6-dehydratase FlaA1 and capsular polysaccharide biosynthesis protein EpsC n=1 Tax=Aquimonas voraii TaxID=265719 RepID=A0A1G6UVW6_9GAMM|nr:nucleoside-diphosphate sugar epimerase/dehydratase [Aquimonas voraii]SDD45510.1 NDP-sugar epimerase, includes UDP-GlcNAc-inverting 4,6-dehydratase FlaA1 and capsular polysaccharide biosynthesis protein EpsC [Aquimonas voraii]